MKARTGRLALACAIALLALFPAIASAHAIVGPEVSLSGKLQLFSLAVPTEKDGVQTTKVVLNVPAGFAIDSFVSSPGWTRTMRQSGSGDSPVIQQVTWTGGHVPSGEDSLFQFLAEPAATGSYRFTVQQTYSDGSIVDWTGSESSDTPAPTIEAKSSLGGGGSGGVSTLSIIALILGALGLLAGAYALVSGGSGGGRGERRPLA